MSEVSTNLANLPTSLKLAFEKQLNDEIDNVHSRLSTNKFAIESNAFSLAAAATFVKALIPDIFIGEEEELFDLEKVPLSGAVQLDFPFPDPTSYLYLFWYTPKERDIKNAIYLAVTDFSAELSVDETTALHSNIEEELTTTIKRIAPNWNDINGLTLDQLQGKTHTAADPDLQNDSSVDMLLTDDARKNRFATLKHEFCYFKSLFEHMIDGEFEEFKDYGLETTERSYLGFLKELRSEFRAAQYHRKAPTTDAAPKSKLMWKRVKTAEPPAEPTLPVEPTPAVELAPPVEEKPVEPEPPIVEAVPQVQKPEETPSSSSSYDENEDLDQSLDDKESDEDEDSSEEQEDSSSEGDDMALVLERAKAVRVSN